VGCGKFDWCGHGLDRAEQHCTPVLPAFLSACVLAKVVVAKAKLNNNVHPLYTCAAGTADESQ
jgi:hypothetical protein